MSILLFLMWNWCENNSEVWLSNRRVSDTFVSVNSKAGVCFCVFRFTFSTESFLHLWCGDKVLSAAKTLESMGGSRMSFLLNPEVISILWRWLNVQSELLPLTLCVNLTHYKNVSHMHKIYFTSSSGNKSIDQVWKGKEPSEKKLCMMTEWLPHS